jgi:hypothetical protein
LLVLVLDIIAIVSILTGAGSPVYKLAWTLIVLLFPVIGMVVYFIVGRETIEPVARV